MKQIKNERDGGSTVKASKYSFIPPGAIGKERGRGRGRGLGHRSMCSLGVSRNDIELTPPGADIELTPINHILSHLSKKDSVIPEKELMQTKKSYSLRSDTQLPPSTGHELHHTKKKNSLPSGIELEQNGIQLPPSTDELHKQLPSSTVQLPEHNQAAEIGSCTSSKVKRVRGRNKCKQVASLEAGKLKLTFYNNRTVGKTNALFSRHLGIIVRDRHMCPLGVASWNDIEEEKLNHMWAAVKDKFESDDMDIHRDHIFRWMRDLWNRWRGNLHAKYVKGKPIEDALKNKPKGVDEKQWEWLVKEHFSSESFQAKSIKNTENRTMLKMTHRTGSKPIREIIYQKGGKEGNPPDLAAIFFETRKKGENLVESEAIAKHEQIQELVQSEPSLPTIEIVERCFGPQSRSHVFGFGGGVKVKDMKDGTSSKAELQSELRSTQAENQYLKERLSNMENDVNELKQLKELLLAQQSHVEPAMSHFSKE